MNYRRQWKDGRMDGSFAERVCLWTGGTLVAVLVLGVALSTSVGAQNTDDLRVVLDRMERLERDIRTLNLSLSRGRPVTPPVSGAKPVPAVPKAGPRGATADWEGNPGLARMEVRLSALENDLRSATGSMEQFGFQIREIGKRLDKLVSDMDYRLSVLEGRTQGQPGAVSGARTAAPPRLSAAPAPPPVQKIIPGQAGGFAIPPTTLGTISQNSQSVVTPPATQKRLGQKSAPAAAKTLPAAQAASRAGRPRRLGRLRRNRPRRQPPRRRQSSCRQGRRRSNTTMPSVFCARPITTRRNWRCRNSSSSIQRKRWPATPGIGWVKPFTFVPPMCRRRRCSWKAFRPTRKDRRRRIPC